MKQVNEKFHQSIVSFIQANTEFFNDLQTSYSKAEQFLNERLDKSLAEITVNDLNALNNVKEQELVIELGNFMTSLRKVAKRKIVSEYISEHLDFNPALCHLSIQAFDFFYIKNEIGNTSRFKQLLKGYQDHTLNENEICELHDTIHHWQREFNNHHLMRFGKTLFGMSYKTLKGIKQDCFEQTYGTYAVFNFNKNGATITRKDGTIVPK